MNHQQVIHHVVSHNITLGSAMLSIVSAFISFFSHSLVVVQWFAAAMAIVAGTVSVVTGIRAWRKLQ